MFRKEGECMNKYIVTFTLEVEAVDAESALVIAEAELQNEDAELCASVAKV